MNQNYYVYIMTNKHRTVLYIGITNDMQRRVYEHVNKILPGFTKKYNLDQLVYIENYNDIKQAIKREKQLKGWSRKKKDTLIIKSNPCWDDLIKEI
ncbi:MAG: GIY-YIG nuclease family protein [Eubacteriales bacterium]